MDWICLFLFGHCLIHVGFLSNQFSKMVANTKEILWYTFDCAFIAL